LNPTPAQLRALARRDPVLGAAMKRVPAFPGFPDGRGGYDSHFHALARAIISQQLATKAAATIHGRVVALTPGRRFPRAEQVLELPEADLRGAGLSGAKQLAIRDLARKSLEGTVNLRALSRRPDQEVIDSLVQVRGIGVWSAQMFLLFRLGRLNVMPVGDLGVREGARRLDGQAERPTEKELLQRSEPWGPLCSVASWVCWRLTD
jgi:DNA-3-methyladenine glycosylase II